MAKPSVCELMNQTHQCWCGSVIMSGWLVYLSAAWFLNTRFSGCLKKKFKKNVCKAVRIRSHTYLCQPRSDSKRERERQRQRQTDRQRQSLEWSEKVLWISLGSSMILRSLPLPPNPPPLYICIVSFQPLNQLLSLFLTLRSSHLEQPRLWNQPPLPSALLLKLQTFLFSKYFN